MRVFKWMLFLDAIIQALLIIVLVAYGLVFLFERMEYNEMMAFIWLALLGIYQVLSALSFSIIAKDYWRLIYFSASLLVSVGIYGLSYLGFEGNTFRWIMLLPILMGGFYFWYSMKFFRGKFKKEAHAGFE